MEPTPGQPPNQTRYPLRRPGCLIALVVWFVVLLSPCILLFLAIRGEISISTGSAPDQRVRIWLIQEPRQSGIGLSNTQVRQNADGLCVQTNVSFVLWQGEAEPTAYCECYTQAETGWQIVSAEEGACQIP